MAASYKDRVYVYTQDLFSTYISMSELLHKLRQHSANANAECCCSFGTVEISSKDTTNKAFAKFTDAIQVDHSVVLECAKTFHVGTASTNVVMSLIDKGKDVIAADYWYTWKDFVIASIHDINSGFEIACCLALVKLLNDDNHKLSHIFDCCYDELQKQCHTKHTFENVMHCIAHLHYLGKLFVVYVNAKQVKSKSENLTSIAHLNTMFADRLLELHGDCFISDKDKLIAYVHSYTDKEVVIGYSYRFFSDAKTTKRRYVVPIEQFNTYFIPVKEYINAAPYPFNTQLGMRSQGKYWLHNIIFCMSTMSFAYVPAEEIAVSAAELSSYDNEPYPSAD